MEASQGARAQHFCIVLVKLKYFRKLIELFYLMLPHISQHQVCFADLAFIVFLHHKDCQSYLRSVLNISRVSV